MDLSKEGFMDLKEDVWIKQPVLTRESNGKRHLCFIPCKSHLHGAAIEECFEDKVFNLFVSNGEYGSQVNFCPMCGYEAINKIIE
jgi:hypothetical protein